MLILFKMLILTKLIDSHHIQFGSRKLILFKRYSPAIIDSKNKLKKSIINRQKNVNKHFSLYKNMIAHIWFLKK